MNTHYQILIIGGVTACLITASSLLRKNPIQQIVIIEPSEKALAPTSLDMGWRRHL